MDTVNELLAITSRFEHLENAAEWITRETVNTDSSISQTSTLITVLAEELRERVYDLIHELELNSAASSEDDEWDEKIQ